MSKYKWVFPLNPDGRPDHNAKTLDDVGIDADGSLYNPNNYPEDIVRAAVLAADARRHERRSKAAKKAAVTRAQRIEKKVYAVVKALLGGGQLTASRTCLICGKGCSDPESIKRGIGSDCWQHILSAMSAMDAAKRKAAS